MVVAWAFVACIQEFGKASASALALAFAACKKVECRVAVVVAACKKVGYKVAAPVAYIMVEA